MAIAASKLLAGIPAGLRDPLIQEYVGLMCALNEGRWKLAGVDAGRFCEVAYTILDGAIGGSFANAPSKPQDFPTACRQLQNKTAAGPFVGERSLRMLIPRVLPGIYDIRNNRDVGHVGGDVVANQMDAIFVCSACSWVLAEFIRVFHAVSTEEAQEAVSAIVERKVPLIWEIDGIKRVLAPGMGAADKVLLLLYQGSGWLDVKTLCKSIKYSNVHMLRKSVLKPMDEGCLIEFQADSDRVHLTPLGAADVERRLLVV